MNTLCQMNCQSLCQSLEEAQSGCCRGSINRGSQNPLSFVLGPQYQADIRITSRCYQLLKRAANQAIDIDSENSPLRVSQGAVQPDETRPVQLICRLKGPSVSALHQAALLTNRRGRVCSRTQIA